MVIPAGWVEIGIVVKSHGVKGALRARLHNPESSNCEKPSAMALLLESGAVVPVLGVGGRSAEHVAVRVEGVASREAAERLRGAPLLLRRSAIGLAREEYLYVDLQGCEVHEGTKSFGIVVDVFCAGASDVLVVRDGDKERLIPLVDDWVVDVDVQRKTIQLRGGDQWDAV